LSLSSNKTAQFKSLSFDLTNPPPDLIADAIRFVPMFPRLL
jgi:hypothetical protein